MRYNKIIIIVLMLINQLFILPFLIFSKEENENYNYTIKYYKARFYKNIPGNPFRHQFVSVNERMSTLKDWEVDQEELSQINDYDKVYYDVDYNVSKIEMYSNKKITSTTLYKYNDFGYETEMSVLNPKGKVVGVWDYSYDKNGNRTEAILYNSTKKNIQQKWNYYYDRKGLLTKIEEYFSDGIPHYFYYYDAEEEPIKVEVFKNWELKNIFYYKKGVKILKNEFYSSKRMLEKVIWFDDNNKPLRIDTYNESGDYIRTNPAK